MDARREGARVGDCPLMERKYLCVGSFFFNGGGLFLNVEGLFAHYGAFLLLMGTFFHVGRGLFLLMGDIFWVCPLYKIICGSPWLRHYIALDARRFITSTCPYRYLRSRAFCWRSLSSSCLRIRGSCSIPGEITGLLRISTARAWICTRSRRSNACCCRCHSKFQSRENTHPTIHMTTVMHKQVGPRTWK